MMSKKIYKLKVEREFLIKAESREDAKSKLYAFYMEDSIEGLFAKMPFFIKRISAHQHIDQINDPFKNEDEVIYL